MKRFAGVLALVSTVALLGACDGARAPERAAQPAAAVGIEGTGQFEIIGLEMLAPGNKTVNLGDKLDRNNVINITMENGKLEGRIASSGNILYQAVLVSSKAETFRGEELVVDTYRSTLPEDVGAQISETLVVVLNRNSGLVTIRVQRRTPDGGGLNADLVALDPRNNL